MSTTHTTTASSEGGGMKSMIGWGLIILAILLMILLAYAKRDKKEDQPRANTPPATAATHVQAQPPWTLRTLDIPPGGLRVYLFPGWQDFALGGDITITTPSGQILKDQPGADHNFGSPPEGIYIFLADPPGAKRKVGIYNRW